jgi:hypothetical protein
MRLTLNLTDTQAAALKRFAEKVSLDQTASVLYPHLSKELRADQAYEILYAFAALDDALGNANVHSWPWIETGRPR